ncbi:MAG: hypothetical protein ACI8V5_003730, partial [Limisphaerales bacterium]
RSYRLNEMGHRGRRPSPILACVGGRIGRPFRLHLGVESVEHPWRLPWALFGLCHYVIR